MTMHAVESDGPWKYPEDGEDGDRGHRAPSEDGGDDQREPRYNEHRARAASLSSTTESCTDVKNDTDDKLTSLSYNHTTTAAAATTASSEKRRRKRSCCQRPRKRRNSSTHDVIGPSPPSPTFWDRMTQVALTSLYVLLAVIAFVVTYSLIANLVEAMRHPVRSINYKKVDVHSAPGIAIYPGGALFPACQHYYQNVVTSKVRLSDLELGKRNCEFINMTYSDPLTPNVTRNAVIIRGPSDVTRREAVFIHFRLTDLTRDFFTVSYFLFPDWDLFNRSSDEKRVSMLLDWHRIVPTFALSAGFRFWTKISMKETFFMDDSKYTEFRTEYSVVEFHDQRPQQIQNDTHLFFIFFEWKNNIIEQSFLIYATTPWNIGASLCGVFLTLHKGLTLVQDSIRRIKKQKRKRKEVVTSLVREQLKGNDEVFENEESKV